ncbi:hypothetical protein D9757_005060 [Collybiopsis confluens]|uniref:Yeast cell wall synthesis Kre9/Knh1-like N-terminal domain-containing protein n=1 Tax=Collybiopsis confluens TaxID=2823264 RepID=A0A8H5MBZ8_9AGAR|nr:hypothetical protein D9757_005060 [Collybiopsis confluens]
MQFTLSIASALIAAFSAASASPMLAHRAQLDVFSPNITAPTASSVWTLGGQYNVTWITTNAPDNISNGASVVLGNNTRLTSRKLAQGFDLRQGWVTVTCPDDIFPGNAYSIILFGDSGDQSAQFSVVAGGSGDSNGSESASSSTSYKSLLSGIF